jgi:hypothetical protein
MIHVFIPLPLKRAIPGRMVESLKAQTVLNVIHECRTPGEDNPNAGRTALALQGEKTSREMCQAEAAKVNEPYIIMCDGDRACVNSNDDYRVMTTNVEDAIAFLDANPEYGAVSLVHTAYPNDDNNPYIDIGWVMYRSGVFAKLKFDLGEKEKCYCWTVTRQIRAMGLKFGYVDEKQRVMHV